MKSRLKSRCLLLTVPFLVAFDNAPTWLTADKLLSPDRTFTSTEDPGVAYACYTEGSSTYTVKSDLEVLAEIGDDPGNWHETLDQSLLSPDACDQALCHGTQAEIDAACGIEPPPPPPPAGELRLSEYSPGAFVSTGNDASGITVLPDGKLLITRQTVFEIRSEAGQLLSTRSTQIGDLEGVEYSGGIIYGVNESPGHNVQYDVNANVVGDSSLPFSNIECIAMHNGMLYYGVEAAGVIADAQANIYIDLGRDLAGCASAGGYLVAVTSHAWRTSTIHKIDTNTWQVIESRQLPDCDCEGIAFTPDLSRMYIIQESSRTGGPGYTVYDRND